MEKLEKILPSEEIESREDKLERLKKEIEAIKDKYPEVASFTAADLENLEASRAKMEGLIADIAKEADVDYEKGWREKMKRELKSKFLKENQRKTEEEIEEYIKKRGLRKVIVSRDILLNPEQYLGTKELDEVREIKRLIEYYDNAISYLNKLSEIEELEK